MNKQARDIRHATKKNYFRRIWRNEIISEAILILTINYTFDTKKFEDVHNG